MVQTALALAVIAFVSALAAGAATGEQEAARVNLLRQHSIVPLNSRIFAGNVLKGEWADNWVVLFCVDWYAPCQNIERRFQAKASEHHRRLNEGALMKNVVRFAYVDCATDKVLCNEQLVEEYPTVVHYKRGEREDAWSGDGPKAPHQLSMFLITTLADADWPDDEQPFLTPEEVRLALRLVAMAAGAVALFVWAVGRGTDIWVASQLQRQQRELKKKASAWVEPRTVPPSRLARRMPREWATQRHTVEL